MFSLSRSLLLSSVVLAGACSGGGGLPTGPSPVAAEIEFRYSASELQKEQSFGCNGVARIFPSWWGFTHQTMHLANEGEWIVLFEEVPVGDQSVTISAPTGCGSSRIRANGIVLEASDDELTFAFTVDYDGRVTR